MKLLSRMLLISSLACFGSAYAAISIECPSKISCGGNGIATTCIAEGPYMEFWSIAPLVTLKHPETYNFYNVTLYVQEVGGQNSIKNSVAICQYNNTDNDPAVKAWSAHNMFLTPDTELSNAWQLNIGDGGGNAVCGSGAVGSSASACPLKITPHTPSAN